AVGLDKLDAITLTFAEPIDAAALARMITLELRPLPGIGGGSGRWMTRDDFEIKTMERRGARGRGTYGVEPESPNPLRTRTNVPLRLPLDDDAAESSAEFAFATAEPFRVLAVGCRAAGAYGETVRRAYPVTPEGSRYSADQALNCGADNRTLLIEFSTQPRDL